MISKTFVPWWDESKTGPSPTCKICGCIMVRTTHDNPQSRAPGWVCLSCDNYNPDPAPPEAETPAPEGQEDKAGTGANHNEYASDCFCDKCELSRLMCRCRECLRRWDRYRDMYHRPHRGIDRRAALPDREGQ